MARTISDVVRDERPAETILQRDHDTGELVAAPAPRQRDHNVVSLDGKLTSPRVNFRPNKPLPVETVANFCDNGRLPPVANDNRPLPYPLKDMADRQELGDNEYENRRNWENAELFRIHLALALGEPLCPFTEDPTAKTPHARFIHARQVVALAEDYLCDGFRVLKRVLVDYWTAQMVGSESGRHNTRAPASASGQAMILAALRQLTRFYEKLDRIERTGESPRFVMPMVGTFAITRPAVPHPQRGKSYLNQAPGPVRLAEPWVSTPHTA
ncbi:hypothetical protein [Bradyrhizobium sp. LTSP849]|uniref:hypothetical protein n=1 Tax=Bradyrhizobium sp. LTSP849 TaxID=1615890 RepID=UPI000B0B1FFC|nr:hypothetical protein [Bradyrhizobium sp. LTSP849]